MLFKLIPKSAWIVGLIMLVCCIVVGVAVSPIQGLIAAFSGFWVWVGITGVLAVGGLIDRLPDEYKKDAAK
jgi:hypothetical protein